MSVFTEAELKESEELVADTPRTLVKAGADKLEFIDWGTGEIRSIYYHDWDDAVNPV